MKQRLPDYRKRTGRAAKQGMLAALRKAKAEGRQRRIAFDGQQTTNVKKISKVLLRGGRVGPVVHNRWFSARASPISPNAPATARHNAQDAMNSTPDPFAGLPTMPADTLPAMFPDALAARAGTQPLPSERAIRRRVARRTAGHLQRVEKATALLLPLPEPGAEIVGTMSGGIDGWSLVCGVIELCRPAIIERLTVSTLGYSEANAAHLFGMLDRDEVRHVRFLLSSYFRSVDAKLFHQLHAGLTGRGHQCIVRRVHSKTVLVETTDARYVIEGSMNLRSCKNLETWHVANDAGLYAFHEEWMETLIREGSEK